MRRRHTVLHEPPAHLRVFNGRGLDDPGLDEALTAWREARKVYYAEHGWPGGFLVMLQQHVAVARQLDPPDSVSDDP